MTQPLAASSKSAAVAPAASSVEHDEISTGLVAQFKYWFTTQAPSWAASAVVHMVLFLIAVLVLGAVSNNVSKSTAPSFTAVVDDVPEPTEFQRFELGPPEVRTSILDDAALEKTSYEPPLRDPNSTTDTNEFIASSGGTLGLIAESGDWGTVMNFGPGPAMPDPEGLPGGGGNGPFGNRRPGTPGSGVGHTKPSERAVAAALSWLARHQNADGSWSIEHNTAKCSDPGCKYSGGNKADVGATAMALLPFLAAGQTHQSKSNAKKGTYQDTVARGIRWLIAKQKAGGDLSTLPAHQMYEHGLATIALCECYGMSGDDSLRYPTQAALNFIASGQNGKGGWRYQHGAQDTDTSVVGWQIMALKSGQMAKLQVNPAVLEKAKLGLLEAASGEYRGKFGYQPNNKNANPPMTAVGLLCLQYLGTPRGDAGLNEGIDYLMKAMPLESKAGAPQDADIYYWYYATQVMHNVPGADWEKWNRNMRSILVKSQVRGNVCAEGSWNPAKDNWGSRAGGRLMTTALSALTLEVYYRYLPLYKLDKDEDLEKAKVM